MTNKTYACRSCGFVDVRTIIHKRVDSEEEYHYTPPYPSTSLASHGIRAIIVCKECNTETTSGYKSDCKLGYCGIKKSHYAGGTIEERQGVKLCPVCRNTFSHGTFEEATRPCTIAD